MPPYYQAQIAIANLKSAIYQLLSNQKEHGMTNAQIGRALGIYTGHKGHEGHVPRTLLAIMENEGVVKQNEDKTWVLC
ncbi:MAG: hypothetical protein RIE52_05620 [Balneola sp.]